MLPACLRRVSIRRVKNASGSAYARQTGSSWARPKFKRRWESWSTSSTAMAFRYAVIGAMALNEFGYRRVTVDVDVLLTPEGLQTFKARHLGRGYVEKFPGSRGMRDTEHGIDIDVVLTGSYPGDGKPKPVVFPDPAHAAERGARVALLPLPMLLELKLASGLTAPDRLKDLADVQEVIRIAKLPRTLGADLDPFVRDKYLESMGRRPTST